MKNNIIISIIIPTYNRYNITKKLITQFINLSDERIEIIVIDDGSTDNTPKLKEEFKFKNFNYFKIKNSERGFARNYGVSKSSGKYINFFDSDDEPLNNHIKSAKEVIHQYKYDVFHTSYVIQKKNRIIKYQNFGVLNSKLRKCNILSLNNVFIKREIALKNKFVEDRKLSGTEDWLLWYKIIKKYKIFGFKTITSKINDNGKRSSAIENYNSLMERVNYLEIFLNSNNYFQNNLSEMDKKMILSEMNSIICLYLSFFDQKTKVIKFFFKSLTLHYNTLFRIRNVIILKNIFKFL